MAGFCQGLAGVLLGLAEVWLGLGIVIFAVDKYSVLNCTLKDRKRRRERERCVQKDVEGPVSKVGTGQHGQLASEEGREG